MQVTTTNHRIPNQVLPRVLERMKQLQLSLVDEPIVQGETASISYSSPDMESHRAFNSWLDTLLADEQTAPTASDMPLPDQSPGNILSAFGGVAITLGVIVVVLNAIQSEVAAIKSSAEESQYFREKNQEQCQQLAPQLQNGSISATDYSALGCPNGKDIILGR